jgi:hypothetical protein
MDKRIDWAALPTLAELYEVDDVEAWLAGLFALRRKLQDREAP